MKHQTLHGKRIIWESRTWQILLVIGCFLFVAAAIWVHQQISSLVFWVTLIFFGGGGLLTLLELLNPNNIFAKPSAAMARQILAEQIKEKQEDTGLFSYDDNGFTFTQPAGATRHQWTDIEFLFGYIVSYHDDRCAIDEICLDIFTLDHAPITLAESTPGWHQFLNRLSENIPTVPRGWVEEITVSASAAKRTVLFDKHQQKY